MVPIKKLVVRVGSQNKAISITRLVDVLSGVQGTVFSIGDFLQNKNVRTGGNFPDSIRETCELRIVNVKQGSVQVELEVPAPEQTTFAASSLGEKALGIFSDMTDRVGTTKYKHMIEQEIPDPISRLRVLQRFRDVIPSISSDFVEVYGAHDRKRQLKVEDRAKIDSILPRIELKDSKPVIGRLMELKAGREANFQIDTPTGIIKGKYTPNCLDFFKRNFNNLVRLKGTFKTPSLMTIDENSLMENMKNYPIREFKYRSKTYSFVNPLQIDVNFEEGENIFSEQTLGLLVVGKTFDECNKRLETQLVELWKEYAEPESTNFSPSAKEFRKKLLEMVK